ncbi:hypothetical protein A2160_05440 [Candidatus Beckwithbacteria bacterium RBG_13_42_9]|uniref:Uncharacterized protein n=1 Tax=Candidatus Beckwithbacteria bacterium RBG_13_42_9 TaxID=1797457 RepID=A0A1F5E7D0_9BACT|nr:MAG: hypothetical protein A2160_05440 [Candidatus Beckwithbacteria bacterium RBG_13_42_9]
MEQVYIQGLFFTQADPYLWQTQRKAAFQVVSPAKIINAKGIMVLPRSECQGRDIGVKILKTFAREGQLFDYCVVSLKNT